MTMHIPTRCLFCARSATLDLNAPDTFHSASTRTRTRIRTHAHAHTRTRPHVHGGGGFATVTVLVSEGCGVHDTCIHMRTCLQCVRGTHALCVNTGAPFHQDHHSTPAHQHAKTPRRQRPLVMPSFLNFRFSVVVGINVCSSSPSFVSFCSANVWGEKGQAETPPIPTHKRHMQKPPSSGVFRVMHTAC